MSAYIMEAVAQAYPDDVRFIPFEKIPSHGINKVRKFLRAFVIRRRGLWTNHFYTERFRSAIAQITADDRVLFFSVKHLKDLCIMDRELLTDKRGAYLWDPMSSICKGPYRRWEYQFFLHRTDMHVYSFDPVDARNFGFNYLPQVYRRPLAAQWCETKTVSDVFFIGQDKGRSLWLAHVATLMKKAGLIADIRIFRDRHTEELSVLKPYYTSQRIPYADTLTLVGQCHSVLEIVQQGQHGLTLRVMEALFMQKKLITNNADVMHYDFYHPDNVLILTEETSADEMRDFMRRPYHQVAEEVVRKYDVIEWIKKFLPVSHSES